MSLDTRVTFGGRAAQVDSCGALLTAPSIAELPAPGSPNRLRYFNALVGSLGTDTGTTNMRVDGSITPVDFYIEAHDDYDIHIMVAQIIFSDTAVAHNTFGNVAALANGWDLIARESGEETKVIDAATTGGEVIAEAGLVYAFGSGTGMSEILNWTGTEDAQAVAIPFDQMIPGGLRLGRGTGDRLISVVNDDLQGLVEFTVRALGYRHYP